MLLPCLPLNEHWERLAPQREDLAQALALPATWQRAWCDAPSSPWRLLVRLVATLPASAAHYECGSGGLARHLLRVAQLSVARLRAAAAATPDSLDPLTDATARERVVIALAASVRALGVIWRQEVQATPGGPTWPRLRYLSDWAQEQHALQLSVIWTPGVRGGADGHGALGAALLALVLPPALGVMLGPRGLNRLLALVVADAPPAVDAECQLLEDAAALARHAGCAHAAALALAPGAPTAIRTDRDGHAPPLLTSAAAVRAALRELLAQTPDRAIAGVDAPALCSATHTILFLSIEPARSLLPALAARLARTGPVLPGTAPGSSWPWMLTLLRELAPQQLPDETPWCVPADPAASDLAEGIMHLVVVTDPQRGLQRHAPALILRNRVLWDDASSPPLSATDMTPGRLLVRCVRDHRGHGSVDAEELGFASGPALPEGLVATGRHRALSVASRVLVSAQTIRDLPSVTRDLVAVTAALWRARCPGPTPAHWRHLLAALPDPLPVALVIDVLEAVGDQLHDLSKVPDPTRPALPGSVPPAAS